MRVMNLSALLRDDTLSSEDLMVKIHEDMINAAHDVAFCEALEKGEDPEVAARAAISRLMEPIDY